MTFDQFEILGMIEKKRTPGDEQENVQVESATFQEILNDIIINWQPPQRKMLANVVKNGQREFVRDRFFFPNITVNFFYDKNKQVSVIQIVGQASALVILRGEQ